MTKILKALEAAGWVDTTLGECRPGEEVVIVDNGYVRHEFITRADVTRGTVSDAKGFQWAAETPAQRPPRPECAPGTVALITWDEGDDHVRNLLPVRAMMGAEGAWHGAETDPPRSLDRIEVIRVLLPADQDTPTIEVTDEMVERAAEARYFASYEGPTAARSWGKVCEAFPDAVAIFRRGVRAALEAALGGGES